MLFKVSVLSWWEDIKFITNIIINTQKVDIYHQNIYFGLQNKNYCTSKLLFVLLVSWKDGGIYAFEQNARNVYCLDGIYIKVLKKYL